MAVQPRQTPPRRAGGRVPPRLLRTLGDGRKRGKRSPVRTILLTLAVLFVVVPVVMAAVGGVYYVNTANSLRPRLAKLETYRPFQTSRVVDRNGILLYEFVSQGSRDPVVLKQVSKLLLDATLSIEDKTFYQNVGVDYLSLAKAVYRNIAVPGSSGASTITQQLIKLVILEESELGSTPQQLARRKITEAILAQELTKEKSKDEILELYVNEINYGNLAYGIQAASERYFGKNAGELNLNEASLLAGIPQLPTKYNPIQFMDANRVLPGVVLPTGWLNSGANLPDDISAPRYRQVDVLRQMVLNGAVTKVTEKQAREAIAQSLQFVPQEVPLQAPHFVFYVRDAINNDPVLGKLLASEGGLTITTTLDLRLQRIAQQEAVQRIDALVVEGRNIHNAAVVMLQPGTGQILAMLGSVNYNRIEKTTTPGEEKNVIDGKVNVTTALRQPGSALKPFTYLSALEQGKLDAGSVLWDVETRFPIKLGANDKNIDDEDFWYGPKNFSLKWNGPIRMRESLANSLNMPAIKALKIAEIGPTLDLLHRAGINSLNEAPNYYGLALTLGGGEVTPLDLTTAYNTLANGGMYIPSTPVLRITDRSGQELKLNVGEPRRAVDEKYVAIVRDFMGDNEARTPVFGRNNQLFLSRPSHAKTGTTEDFRDAWAVGYTPYLTVGVWTGNNNNEKTAKVESVTGGGVIYHNIMERVFADATLDRMLRGDNLSVPLDFPSPKTFGLEERKVCKLGGAFGQREREWFVPNDGKNLAATPGKDTGECDLYKMVRAVRKPSGSFCLPQKGRDYGAALIEFRAYNLPKSEEDAKIIDAKFDAAKNEAYGVAPTEVCSADIGDTLRPTAKPTQTADPNATSTPTKPGTAVPGNTKPTAVPTSRNALPPTAPPADAPPALPTKVALPTAEDAPAPVVPTEAPAPIVPTREPAPVVPTEVPAPVPTRAPPQVVPTEPPPPPAPTAPPPAALVMPNLVGLGENQARAKLADLGITSVVVDYQGRDRLGDKFDQFAPYAVVSHSPGPGTPIGPGTDVVLGVREP